MNASQKRAFKGHSLQNEVSKYKNKIDTLGMNPRSNIKIVMIDHKDGLSAQRVA